MYYEPSCQKIDVKEKKSKFSRTLVSLDHCMTFQPESSMFDKEMETTSLESGMTMQVLPQIRNSINLKHIVEPPKTAAYRKKLVEK